MIVLMHYLVGLRLYGFGAPKIRAMEIIDELESQIEAFMLVGWILGIK